MRCVRKRNFFFSFFYTEIANLYSCWPRDSTGPVLSCSALLSLPYPFFLLFLYVCVCWLVELNWTYCVFSENLSTLFLLSVLTPALFSLSVNNKKEKIMSYILSWIELTWLYCVVNKRIFFNIKIIFLLHFEIKKKQPKRLASSKVKATHIVCDSTRLWINMK